MSKVLPSAFFDRPTLTVAKELLGKYLVRKVGSKVVALMITETEAYHGFSDLASHARRGKTPRNTPMFDHPGTIYVYFTYGMHWMLNLVCGKKEFPAAVLVRGLSSAATAQRAALKAAKDPRFTARHTVAASLLNGPAKLTKFLQIDKSLNHQMLSKKTGLWVEDRGVIVRPRNIVRTPRIGIAYAGEYAKKPWRFVLKKVIY